MPKWHDIATGLLIAKEAGAIVDTEDNIVVAAANEKIYNDISRIIKN